MKKNIKIFSALAITALTVSMMSATAFAHGGRGSYSDHHSSKTNQQHPQYTICTVEQCTKTGYHQHDGNWYCSQSGHTGNYAVCTVNGCTEVGLHQHDGTYYHCQNQNIKLGYGRGHHR